MFRFEIDDLRVLDWPSLSKNVIITSNSQLNTASPFTTNITFASGIGNNMEFTELDFTRFILLKQVFILDHSLNNVTRIISKGLPHLVEIFIGQDSMKSIQKYYIGYCSNP